MSFRLLSDVIVLSRSSYEGAHLPAGYQNRWVNAFSFVLLPSISLSLSFSFSFSPSLVPVFLFPVGRLVWEEKDLEAETRAEGTEGRHLYACWQERERWSRKIKEVPEFQKKKKMNRKKTRKEKTKRRQNICTFFSLCLTFVPVCTCFFFVFFFSLEVTEKV